MSDGYSNPLVTVRPPQLGDSEVSRSFGFAQDEDAGDVGGHGQVSARGDGDGGGAGGGAVCALR